MNRHSRNTYTTQHISVLAPARLHLGFMDMNGGLGRYFGSLGLCLSDIYTRLSAIRSSDVAIHGKAEDRASLYAEQILSGFNIEGGVKINIHSSIPPHTGLGSGTQLALAIGVAITKLYGIQVSVEEIAALMSRGTRSGIGVGAFSKGGFLVDGGQGEDTTIPPLISHTDFPEEWAVLLIFDKHTQGLHGLPEKLAFRDMPMMDEQLSAYICRLVLMQVLPALVEKNCHAFGSAITEIQRLTGDYFSATQGSCFSSQLVADILPCLQDQGATGVGQSSWGPTGFAFFANNTQAFNVLRDVRKKWRQTIQLDFKLCHGRNQMAEIITNAKLKEISS